MEVIMDAQVRIYEAQSWALSPVGQSCWSAASCSSSCRLYETPSFLIYWVMTFLFIAPISPLRSFGKVAEPYFIPVLSDTRSLWNKIFFLVWQCVLLLPKAESDACPDCEVLSGIKLTIILPCNSANNLWNRIVFPFCWRSWIPQRLQSVPGVPKELARPPPPNHWDALFRSESPESHFLLLFAELELVGCLWSNRQFCKCIAQMLLFTSHCRPVNGACS